MYHKSVSINIPTAKGVPHKVQVQAATVAGLGESREVEEVLFSEEQGTVSVLQVYCDCRWSSTYTIHVHM